MKLPIGMFSLLLSADISTAYHAQIDLTIACPLGLFITTHGSKFCLNPLIVNSLALSQRKFGYQL